MTDGGWYTCASSGTYFAVYSTSTTVIFVEVMLYSYYAIQMFADSATITNPLPDGTLNPNNLINTNKVIISETICNVKNTCTGTSLASATDNPSYAIALRAETNILAVVLLPISNDQTTPYGGNYLLYQNLYVKIASSYFGTTT